MRIGDECDYRLRLNWEGRRVKRPSYDDDAELLPLTRTLSDDFGETVAFEPPLSREPQSSFESHQQPHVQYEFEHTLFEDFHQVSRHDVSSTVATKKKPKSMDDSYALDRLDDNTGPGNTLRLARRNLSWRPASVQSPFIIGSPMASSCASPAFPPNMTSKNIPPQSSELEFGLPNPLPSPRDLQWSNSWVWDSAPDSGAMGSPHTSTITSSCSEDVAQGPSWLDELLPESAESQVCIANPADGLVEYPVLVGNELDCPDNGNTCNTHWPQGMYSLNDGVVAQGNSVVGISDVNGALEKCHPFTGPEAAAKALYLPPEKRTQEDSMQITGILSEIGIWPEKCEKKFHQPC